MSTTHEDLRKEYMPYFGTVVLDLSLKLGLLVDIINVEDDLYYEIITQDRDRVLQTCIGRVILLKGFVPEDDYNYLKHSFYINKQ